MAVSKAVGGDVSPIVGDHQFFIWGDRFVIEPANCRELGQARTASQAFEVTLGCLEVGLGDANKE